MKLPKGMLSKTAKNPKLLSVDDMVNMLMAEYHKGFGRGEDAYMIEVLEGVIIRIKSLAE